jgi:enediyne biosynthesis protein E4
MITQTFKVVSFLFFALVLITCSNDKSEDKGADNSFTFIDPKQSGINFTNQLTQTDSLNIVEYLYYYNGGGVAIGDLNNDGLEDVFFTANQSSDKLFLNKGALKFEDITQKSGIVTDSGWSTGVAIDDVNNDGWKDIYVCRVDVLSKGSVNHNLLYINQKDGTFKEMSKEFGLDFAGFSTHAAFFDYDRDGDLDMYLLNHAIHNVRSYGNVERRSEKDAKSGDRLYENKINETGKFENVTDQAGIYNSPMGYGLAIAVEDVNNDGWQDIYIGNDFHENDYLYINTGKKSFVESSAKYLSHTSQFSMGVDFADMNNDGKMDFFTTDMMPFDEEVLLSSAGEDSDNVKRIKRDFGFGLQHARNHFQINEGVRGFSDIAYQTRTFATDWSWSVLLEDFNQDRKTDIFITNGIVNRPNNLDYINYLNELDNANPAGVADRTKKLIERMPSQPMKNILFKQSGDLTFSDVLSSQVGKPSFSTGAAYSDLDNDGDLDIVTNNINEAAFLMENKSNGSFIKINLKQEKTSVKGARFVLSDGKDTLYKSYNTTRGFLSSSTHNITFSGIQQEQVNLSVIWPNGTVTNYPALKRGSTLEIHVDKDIAEALPYVYSVDQINYTKLDIKHSENVLYDENNEKLIHERLAYDGPALLTHDFNEDGIMDIFLGGARGKLPLLLFGNANGGYRNVPNEDFTRDAKYEDTDAALIDFDGDGDKDLYVVSGGNDNKELDKVLEDRIYLNNGKGDFKRIPLSLPHTNGSVIAVADFDNDGYEDMFVGARSIPGSYGLSPYSFVLKNKGGMGLEIVLKSRIGMVTDAEWGDLDGDKDLDLVVSGDWMPVTVFENKAGTLVDATAKFGLDSLSGFWKSIKLVDLTGDGLPELLAGNAGTNQKWTASMQKPITISIGDYDKNGATDPVIFYHYFKSYIPFASLDKMLSHMPILKKTYTSYGGFKGVNGIEKLYPKYTEDMVEFKKVTELRSMVFVNEKGKFKAVPLSAVDQRSDIKDFFVTKNKSIIYIGNNANYVSELGANLSNSGRVLSGFDVKTNTFTQSKPLPIPMMLSAQKIQALSNNKYLLAINNSNLCTFNLNE